MTRTVNKGRRRFLIVAGALAGGLAVGAWWVYRRRNLLPAPAALTAGPGESIFNAWLKINDKGEIIVQVPRQEMGQGVMTALAMLVAEELDADFADVRVEQAPIDAVYGNATLLGDAVPFRTDDRGWVAELARLTQFKVGRILGLQATGGSTSVRDAWEPMRQAGATARAMLVAAAAQRFGVPEAACRVEGGIITHPGPGQRAGFGDLAAAAAALPMPDAVALKSRRDFKILGRPQPRVDIPAKVDGSAQFGIDVRPPGMVYAAIRQCPVFGGAVAALDREKATAMPGVKAVMALPATSTSAAAVVVVAEHYWQARTALDRLSIRWDSGPHASHDSNAQRRRYESLLDAEPGRIYEQAGDVETGFAAAGRTLDAEYHAPYLAHATMEPMNCTTLIRSDGSAEVWVGNQGPPLVAMVTAQAAGLETDRIEVHTPYLGGGFGRRGEGDVIRQAAMIAMQMPDTPVQLIWSREEDIQHDTYRPMGTARLRAALDASGALSAFEAKIVGQSCTYSLVGRLMPAMQSDLMKDKTTVEGVFDLPYGIPHRRVVQVRAQEPVPVGFWRSVGHSHHAFFAESFMDECAVAAGADPYEYRRDLLGLAPRHRAVLEEAAVHAGWGAPLPTNMGRGIALAESFGSIVAQVAEVAVDDSNVRVQRVVCVIDCGFAVNPDTVAAQMESGIIFGLSAALYGEITLAEGRVQQSNFPDYRMVTLAEAPEIEVHILESGVEHMGGVGEPGTPPIAPAVCNAIYAATGRRVRELPIRL